MSLNAIGARLLCPLNRYSFHTIWRSVSTIKFIDSGDVPLPELPKYDYLGSKYLLTRPVFDSTNERLTQNSRVIAVEGSLLCGKSFLASQLAKHFGMYHIPDATEDDIYTFHDVEPPFDLRLHNALLPKSAKYYTCEMFWTEPDLLKHGKPLYLQYQFLIRRLFNYTKGLSTLFNTGRGVVFDRTMFSDLAFNDALFECGYISERGHRWFNQNHGEVCVKTWRPHIIVYVKTRPEQIREYIKQRNIPWEVNGVNLSDKFLETYSRCLEKNYIVPMSEFCELLVVDSSTTDVRNEDDCLAIARRITEIDLSYDRLLRDDKKFFHWRKNLTRSYGRVMARSYFSEVTCSFSTLVQNIDIPLDLRELCYSDTDREMQYDVMSMDPRTKYAPLYNPYYNSVFDIMFNPFLKQKNFRRDVPKKYLWP